VRRLRSLGAALLLGALWVVAASSGRAEEWRELKNCRLLPNQANDADSFHVQAGGREYIFRLYFVDAPETDASVADRVREQAEYFGITADQTQRLGELARAFTREKLRRPFTVRTTMQDARGRSELPRYFAFVEAVDGDLAELLVANGLARVYGAAATPVGLTSPERQWEKLRRLEQRAKAEQVGAWGVPAGRMTARSATQPAKSGADSFEEFFRSTKAPVAQPARAGPTTGGKLNINSATAEELQRLPGVGPVLASRIVAARPFKSPDDLRQVKGIGDRKYAQLRGYFSDR
jgi:competence ComEA-like helix-hairpin-helix protein